MGHLKPKVFRVEGKILKIYPFEPKNMVENATIALIAKRASGKTWIIRHLMYENKKRGIPASMVISKTEKMNSFYGDYVPDSFIFSKFEPNILPSLFKRQETMMEENKMRKKLHKKPKDKRVLLVMDDWMSDKNIIVKDENIHELFFNGRHYEISLIMALQYSKGLTPELRGNLDYIFLLAEDFPKNRRKLWEEYAGSFKTYDEFEAIFENLTDNFGCMVINNRIHTTDIEKKIFYFKADEITQFKVGDKLYKKFHDKNYDPNYRKNNPTVNTNVTGRKKKNNIEFVK